MAVMHIQELQTSNKKRYVLPDTCVSCGNTTIEGEMICRNCQRQVSKTASENAEKSKKNGVLFFFKCFPKKETK